MAGLYVKVYRVSVSVCLYPAWLEALVGSASASLFSSFLARATGPCMLVQWEDHALLASRFEKINLYICYPRWIACPSCRCGKIDI